MRLVVCRNTHWAHTHAAGGAEAGDELVLPVRGARNGYTHHLGRQIFQEHGSVGLEGVVLPVLRAADGAHEYTAGGTIKCGRLRRCSLIVLVHRAHVACPATVGNSEKVLDNVIGNAVCCAAGQVACWAVHGRAGGDRIGQAVRAYRVGTIEELRECDGPLAATALLWLCHGTRASKVKKSVQRDMVGSRWLRLREHLDERTGSRPPSGMTCRYTR